MHDGSPDLASRTTLRLGGPAGRLVTATGTEEIPAQVRDAGALLVLAGGSNVVVSDAGFPGTVLLLRNRGIRRGLGHRGPERRAVGPQCGEPELLVAMGPHDCLPRR